MGAGGLRIERKESGSWSVGVELENKFMEAWLYKTEYESEEELDETEYEREEEEEAEGENIEAEVGAGCEGGQDVAVVVKMDARGG